MAHEKRRPTPSDSKRQRPSSPKNNTVDSLAVAIGRRLVEAREGLGLSQQSLHARTKVHDAEGKGVSRAALSLYETGVNKPGARETIILCNTLKITPNWLFYGSDSPAKTLQASLEFLHGNEITLSVRLAYAILVLDPEERDAFASLLFSMVGKKLGDLKLSSLMTVAGRAGRVITEQLVEIVGEDARNKPVRDLIELFIKEVGETILTTRGTLRPRIAEEHLGDPDYPPPPPRKLKKS